MSTDDLDAHACACGSHYFPPASEVVVAAKRCGVGVEKGICSRGAPPPTPTPPTQCTWQAPATTRTRCSREHFDKSTRRAAGDGGFLGITGWQFAAPLGPANCCTLLGQTLLKVVIVIDVPVAMLLRRYLNFDRRCLQSSATNFVAWLVHSAWPRTSFAAWSTADGGLWCARSHKPRCDLATARGRLPKLVLRSR